MAIMYCTRCFFFFFFNDTATTEIYTLSLHDALPISRRRSRGCATCGGGRAFGLAAGLGHRGGLCSARRRIPRSEEHTSELQSRLHLVCRLLLEKKKKKSEISSLKFSNSYITSYKMPE